MTRGRCNKGGKTRFLTLITMCRGTSQKEETAVRWGETGILTSAGSRLSCLSKQSSQKKKKVKRTKGRKGTEETKKKND